MTRLLGVVALVVCVSMAEVLCVESSDSLTSRQQTPDSALRGYGRQLAGCGDGRCESGEMCDVCVADCGVCQPLGLVSTCVNHGDFALTFDDGPSYNTAALLDYLRGEKIRATFFVVGQNVNKLPHELLQENNDGHFIASHSHTHANLAKLSDWGIRQEMNNAKQAIEAAQCQKTFVMRPPYGATSSSMLQTIRDMGYIPIYWNLDTNDWRYAQWSPQLVLDEVDRVLWNSPSSIVHLQHDLLAESVNLVPQIVSKVRAAGYRFVTLDECLWGKTHNSIRAAHYAQCSAVPSVGSDGEGGPATGGGVTVNPNNDDGGSDDTSTPAGICTECLYESVGDCMSQFGVCYGFSSGTTCPPGTFSCPDASSNPTPSASATPPAPSSSTTNSAAPSSSSTELPPSGTPTNTPPPSASSTNSAPPSASSSNAPPSGTPTGSPEAPASGGQCTGCWGSTAGPCKAANSVCYGYIPNTEVCPPGTTSCPGTGPAPSSTSSKSPAAPSSSTTNSAPPAAPSSSSTSGGAAPSASSSGAAPSASSSGAAPSSSSTNSAAPPAPSASSSSAPGGQCSNCFGATSGECQTSIGVCYSFIPTTNICWPGTFPCAAASEGEPEVKSARGIEASVVLNGLAASTVTVDTANTVAMLVASSLSVPSYQVLVQRMEPGIPDGGPGRRLSASEATLCTFVVAGADDSLGDGAIVFADDAQMLAGVTNAVVSGDFSAALQIAGLPVESAHVVSVGVPESPSEHGDNTNTAPGPTAEGKSEGFVPGIMVGAGAGIVASVLVVGLVVAVRRRRGAGGAGGATPAKEPATSSHVKRALPPRITTDLMAPGASMRLEPHPDSGATKSSGSLRRPSSVSPSSSPEASPRASPLLTGRSSPLSPTRVTLAWSDEDSLEVDGTTGVDDSPVMET